MLRMYFQEVYSHWENSIMSIFSTCCSPWKRCPSFSSFLRYPHCSIHVDCNHHVHIAVCGWYATWVPCTEFGDSSTVMIFNLKVHGWKGLKLNCLKTQTHQLPSGDKWLFSIIQFLFNMDRKKCSFFLSLWIELHWFNRLCWLNALGIGVNNHIIN